MNTVINGKIINNSLSPSFLSLSESMEERGSWFGLFARLE